MQEATPVIWLTDRDLAARYGVSRITPWRWAKDEKRGFPKPRKLGANTSRWSAAEVEAYDRRMMNQSSEAAA